MRHTFDTYTTSPLAEEFDRLHPDLSVERGTRGDHVIVEALPGSGRRISSVFVFPFKVEAGGTLLPAIGIVARSMDNPNERQQIIVPCHAPDDYLVEGDAGLDIDPTDVISMSREGMELLDAYSSLSTADRRAVDAQPERRVLDNMAAPEVRLAILAACVGPVADMADIEARDVRALWHNTFPLQPSSN